MIRLDHTPDSWEDRVVLYAASLVDGGVQSSTLKSYISAIKSTIKTETNEKWSDEQFGLSAIIKACKLKNDTIYTRLLIGKNLLELMLFKCHHLFSSQPYLLALYQALFALTFYGLM